MTLTAIVGAGYHPPAKAILACLPHGAEIEIVPDPEGQTTGDVHQDTNALSVWVQGSQIRDRATLATTYGLDAEHIMSEIWHVGYIPAVVASKLQLKSPRTGHFRTGANGGPMVEFEP